MLGERKSRWTIGGVSPWKKCMPGGQMSITPGHIVRNQKATKPMGRLPRLQVLLQHNAGIAMRDELQHNAEWMQCDAKELDKRGMVQLAHDTNLLAKL